MSGPFDAYAAYYDLFNRGKDYAGEAAYVRALLERHGLPGRSVLELGCGSGGHAFPLGAAGFEVTGVDRSEAMLDAARRRAKVDPAAARLRFVDADIRSLALGQTFDAVLALFHVMSYQTADADLEATVQAVARHLRSGGLFLFDFWHGPAVLSQRPETRIRRCEGKGIRAERLAEPTLVVAENRVSVTYTITVDHDPTRRPERFEETHDMRYFFKPELRRLTASDFEWLQNLAWMAHQAPTIDDWSAVAILRRR
jgi:SAM-dependent methyltransferase